MFVKSYIGQSAKLSIFLFLFFFATTEAIASDQNDRTVNLSGQTLGFHDQIDINGPWEFYWNTYLFKSDRTLEPDFVDTKLPWSQIDQQGYPALGYGTYSTKIQLPSRTETALSFTMRRVKTAYALYVDGTLISHMGELVDYPTALPQESNSTGIVTFNVPLETDEIEVIIHVSNDSYYRGGLDQPPVLSYAHTAITKRMWSILAAAFTAGGLLFMGIYHFGLWLKRRSNKTSLYFSIFSIAVGVRVFFTYKLFYLIHPEITEALMLRLEIGLAYTALPFLHIFISSVFPAESNRFMTRCSWITWGILICITLFTSLELISSTLTPFKWYFVITLIHMLKMGWCATYNKREGSVLFSVGFIVAIITGIHDVLFENNTIYGVGNPIFPFGVLTFVFIQFILHSMKFSRAYRELEALTNTLEQQVQKRTKELSLAHDSAMKAHEETKFLSNAVINMLEDERKAIARELHDDFGQSIRGAGLYAETISRDLKKLNNEQLHESIANADRIASELNTMYAKNRNLLRRLRPEIIDTLGLQCAIEELLDNYRRNQYAINFICKADVSKLDNKEKITLYRILQESITNITKYAQTRDIDVSLVESTNEFIFQVSDNGIGFEVAKARGIGLISMRERMADIGGTISIQSTPGNGTTIIARVPKPTV